MIGLEQPALLMLVVPWVFLWALFARIQRSACEWIWGRVAPRFQRTLTGLSPAGLRARLGLVLTLGLLLIVASARPTLSGRQEVRELSGRLLVLLDASASMYATDLGASSGETSGENRFEHSRQLLRGLLGSLDSWQLALVTFSGSAVIELPMTPDPVVIEEALRTLEVHSYYRNTGSSVASALDRVFHFIEPGDSDLQVLLIGDGELPFPQPYDEPLEILARQGTPVHAITVGSVEGQARVIYDFQDVVDKKKDRRAISEYTTRRVDEHFERIAKATGGLFESVESEAAGAGAIHRLQTALLERRKSSVRVEEDQRRDVGAWLLAAFLLLYLGEASLRRREPPGEAARFDLRHLGSQRWLRGGAQTGEGSTPGFSAGSRGGSNAGSVASLLVVGALAFLVGSCGRQDVTERPQADEAAAAHARRENSRGIVADAARLFRAARIRYERSSAYGYMIHIPTYNLARSLTLQGQHSEAHDLYQEALELKPDLAHAHHNDGHTLFAWGEAELDPRGCVLDRTLELWTAARTRFAGAIELYGRGRSAADRAAAAGARGNLSYLVERINEIEDLIANPPPECAGSGEASEQSSGSETDPPDQDQDEPSSEPPPAGKPPDPREAETVPAGPEHTSRSPDSGSSDPSGSPGARGLFGNEKEQIAAAFERIRAELLEGDKYYRRTREAQFPKESWQSPDPVIWW